jgi:hypothetical protein
MSIRNSSAFSMGKDKRGNSTSLTYKLCNPMDFTLGLSLLLRKRLSKTQALVYMSRQSGKAKVKSTLRGLYRRKTAIRYILSLNLAPVIIPCHLK